MGPKRDFQRAENGRGSRARSQPRPQVVSPRREESSSLTRKPDPTNCACTVRGERGQVVGTGPQAVTLLPGECGCSAVSPPWCSGCQRLVALLAKDPRTAEHPSALLLQADSLGVPSVYVPCQGSSLLLLLCSGSLVALLRGLPPRLPGAQASSSPPGLPQGCPAVSRAHFLQRLYGP